MRIRRSIVIENSTVAGVAAALAFSLAGPAQTIDPYYAGHYNLRSLGEVPDLPYEYGGLVFKAGDPNTLLIGGNANHTEAQIFQIGVVRDADHHIVGYKGTATYYADAHGLPDQDAGIDGGLIYGPGNVLLFASYDDNSIGEIKPGQSTIAKQIDLSALGVDASVGSLVLVPPGLPGAGRLKILSFNGSTWFDTKLIADGSGTFNLAPVSPSIDLGNLGPEGAFYVSAGNPLFPKASVLVAAYTEDKIVSFEVDANGDPLTNTERDFVTDASAVQGAAQDPVTGDFVFSSFKAGEIWVVGGFGLSAPTVAITSPVNGASFSAPAEFEVSANAAQPGGAIDEVDFYLDNEYIGHDSVGVPYTLAMNDVGPGTHALMAVAYGSGLCSTSSVINIVVGNVPPTVAIVSPAPNTVKSECSDLQLAANAAAAFGSITNVAYYLNSTNFLGSATQPPYLLVVSLPLGVNTLTAIVTDDSGSQATSLPVRVIFAPTPTNAMCASLLISGELKLCFRGLVNSSYVFEHSYAVGDKAAWAPFATNTATSSLNGLIEVVAPFYPLHPARFYRARRVP